VQVVSSNYSVSVEYHIQHRDELTVPATDRLAIRSGPPEPSFRGGSRQLLWNPPTFVTLTGGHYPMTMNVNSGKPWSPVDVYDLRLGLERGYSH
jgi:hypothetical protein